MAELMEQQAHQDHLRFITCGSVGDGKSTLISRLLWESQQICDDHLVTLTADSKRHGSQGDNRDFAFLMDSLAAEREQGVTIEIVARIFATPRRKFMVVDTPGHEQYTRNIVAGASRADLALVLVDARQGVLTQTRRHTYLASLMGIRHVALTVNKLDLVGFDPKVFKTIEENFRAFARTLHFESITAVPVSALLGDNIVIRSPNTPWYTGPTLMAYLETVEIPVPQDLRTVFPVQWVNRPNADFWGFSGTVSSGCIAVDDAVRVTASGQVARVKRLVTFEGDLSEARAGDAVTLVLDTQVDASRGDVISAADTPLDMTDQFEATLIWMHPNAGLVGRSYELKLATQCADASITSIKHRVNVNTLAHESCRQLELNDVVVCTLALSRPLVFDAYAKCDTLGGFILLDRFTQATVAAGLITHNLRRAQNVHRQALSITRPDRERLNGHTGNVIWFTGLSGSGKSTLANALEKELHALGKRTYILDGDNVRQGLNKDLGFTDADRVENIRRVAEVAKLMMDAGLIVLTAFISPFRAEREMARQLIGEENFIEVYVDTPLQVCEQRDPKGLYKKARSGQLPNMTGINSPYEPPEKASISVDTVESDLKVAVAGLLAKIVVDCR
ncbi:MAG: adenylyl-sulfate kinase [Rhodoferax sp.]|uniref:adenylyl-sulfate kinase n=1 Tax=Rhodoferax sp. TaxID=50421 RepID=UPI003267E428